MTEINLTPTATLLQIDPSSQCNKPEIKLPCRTWGITSQSKAAIVLVHGLGAHSGWFEALANRLRSKGIFVLSFDLAGFGKQKDTPFHTYKQWLDNTQTAFTYIQSVMTDKPAFLLGNSMGALIALRAVTSQLVKPSGLILTSPAFAGHPRIFTLSYQLAQLFQAILRPDSEIELPYDTDLISKDEKVQAWLNQDPARRKSVPRRLLLDLFLLTLNLRGHKIKLNCPLFMVTAGADSLVDNEVSELIFHKSIVNNKKKVTLPGAAHDLSLDPALDELSDLLYSWMNIVISQNRLAII